MIKALKEWGELYPYEIWDEVEADNVLVINFDKDGRISKKNGKINLDIYEADSEKLEYYLYREAKSKNPPTKTPTLYLNLRNEKEKNEKIKTSLNNMENIISKIVEHMEKRFPSDPLLRILKNIQGEIERYSKEIQEAIQNEIERTGKAKRYLLTIKIDDKFIGEIDGFKDILKDILESDYKNESFCAICGERKKVDAKIPFYFLTFDKLGYIVGGFDKDKAYRNSPICFDCFEKMRIARRKLEKAKFKIGGLEYLLIPESLNRETLERFKDLMEFLKENEFKLSDIDRVRLELHIKHLLREDVDTERILKELEDDPNKLLVIFKELKDIIWAHFLFIKKEQSRESVKLYINEVFPSRVLEMFEAKKYVKNLLDIDIWFDFKTIESFFTGDSFYEVVGAVFKGRKLEGSFLYSNFMKEIRESYKNEKGKYSEAFASYIFIRVLTEGLNMIALDKPANLEEFFEWVEKLPVVKGGERWKVSVILLGYLTEYLLRWERRDRGSKPFLKKLKGFRMNWEDVLGLLPKLREKLEIQEIYDYEGVKKVFSEISKGLLESDKPKVSVDEINFYFTAGMGLYEKFGHLLFQKKEGGEDEQAEEQA